MTTMQLIGKLTEADLTDLRRMNRSKLYWLNLLGKNSYGIVLIGVLVWVTVSGLLGQRELNWPDVAAIWIVIAAVVIWAISFKTRVLGRDVAQVNASLPEQIILGTDGVKLDGPNGATAFLPWRTFKGWREGRQVVLLDQCEGNRFVILPVFRLPEADQERIRNFLRSYISPQIPKMPGHV